MLSSVIAFLSRSKKKKKKKSLQTVRQKQLEQFSSRKEKHTFHTLQNNPMMEL